MRTAHRCVWFIVGLLAIGGLYYLTEPNTHVYDALPYLLVLVCPLVHLFRGSGALRSLGIKKRNGISIDSPH